MKKTPFFDNHTHVLDDQQIHLSGNELALSFLHGNRDLPDGQVSDDLMEHVRNQGCVYALVHALSRFLGCEPSLEAVAKARELRIQTDGFAAYTKALYADAGTFGSVLDSELPMGDPQVALIPGTVVRHVQMDPLFFSVLKDANHYGELRERVVARIRKAILEDGYGAIKCLMGGHACFTMKARYVSPEEAEMAFAEARGGSYEAQQTVYFALFRELMLEAQALRISIHVHTGLTGAIGTKGPDAFNPGDMVPFLLTVPHMMQTKLVFLHGNFPNVSLLALMTHTFPNLYMDLSWTTPWTALGFTQRLEEVLSIAPVTKIMLGSGQHNIPEISWLAAKVASRSMEHCMRKLTAMDIIDEAQAEEITCNIMYKNACRFYQLPMPQ